MTRICETPDCDRPHHAKGLCQYHYQRQRKGNKIVHRFKDRPEFAEAERLLGLGLTFNEVAKLTDTDRTTLIRNFPNRPGLTSRYWEVLPLVQAGVSLNQIRQTLGMDYRTIRRMFPHYKPFEVGGSPRSTDIREANRVLRELDRTGRVQKNRDAGFNLRGDVL